LVSFSWFLQWANPLALHMIIYTYAMVASAECEQLCGFSQKKRQDLAKIQALPGPAPGTPPGKPEQIPTPSPESRTKKGPSPEEPDPESPMCCCLLPLRDYLLPDNVGVHIYNLLWVCQVCGYFTEVILLVFFYNTDNIKRF